MIVLKTIGYNNDLQPSNLCNQVPACHAKRTRMQEWADYIDAKIYILQYQNLQSNFLKGVWGIQWATQQIYLQDVVLKIATRDRLTLKAQLRKPIANNSVGIKGAQLNNDQKLLKTRIPNIVLED
ncbi:hypothetical protein MTR_8g464810 [Medicago truncatula]|uniref:Uncharacterized protein n=1 Tax=Medicago truncatula TaxID=3880 RepID=A0A072TQV4_MEDTR|nr:hypothetical protein MTR_8g464810 [Medicago truncatula]